MKAVIKLMFLICFTACSGELKEADYVAWFKNYDNKVHTKKVQADFYYDLQYQSPEYLSIVTGQPMSSVVNEISQFRLEIGLNEADADILNYQIKDLSDRESKIYYFSYKFQNDIYLEVNNKKIPCQLFQFEKAYRKNGALLFTLGFPTAQKYDEATLVIQSPMLSSLPIHLTIVKDNIPEVQ